MTEKNKMNFMDETILDVISGGGGGGASSSWGDEGGGASSSWGDPAGTCRPGGSGRPVVLKGPKIAPSPSTSSVTNGPTFNKNQNNGTFVNNTNATNYIASNNGNMNGDQTVNAGRN